ncbi:hypothetical protein UCRPC4_g04800 [Phaeomoniella chlamydospora]|uniref:Uncharacterized protein n=1 Tax=Phaeomoniella chlamydospora TaxID=158046 RepID=A0A0G2E7Y8_PHACM|nr:hypothetical protein UCRPC4_g04800 [Phaeomoniella chlamydospora]
MEGLTSLYAAPDAQIHRHNFNNKNDIFEVAEISRSSVDWATATAACRFLQKSEAELMPWVGCQALNNRPFTRLVLVPLISNTNPYTLDIKESVVKQLLKDFNLDLVYRFAHASGMTFDVIPIHESGAIKGFHCSIYLTDYFGLYVVYDQTRNLTQGICWAGDKLMPRLREALMHLRDLSYHPYYILVATAAAFISYHNLRLVKVHREVSAVEKRTGYQGWDMIAHPTAQGSFPSLSASMSGLATSLAANKRLDRLTNEMLSAALDDQILDLQDMDQQARALFQGHIQALQRRVHVQQMHIKLCLSRVQNQLTAVS